MRAVQRRDRPGLNLKTSAEPGGGDFNGDGPSKANDQRFIDLAYPDSADRRNDFVWARDARRRPTAARRCKRPESAR